MPRPFQLVDVFGQGDFTGNPLAVVLEAAGLDADTMQRIARWLNLSETTFLLPPTTRDADYRVRIFTLDRELPFAGHPTLGSCHAWLTAGGQPRRADEVVQECGAGLVTVRRDGARLAFAAPPLIRTGPVDDAKLAEAAQVLRIAREDIQDARWVDNGPGWMAVRLPSAAAVLALEPLRAYERRIEIGVVGAHAPGGDADYEIRALFSDAHGAIIEDSVTGSLNASVAQWLFASGQRSTGYVAAQGTRLGRQGRVYIDRDEAGQVWVGGSTRSLVSGSLADERAAS
jgi:PhzF family phenazine biosynthesis protein